MSDAKLRLGVSTCLLGENVRFDAGHKHDRYVTDVLGQWFDLVSVCPEMEIGLGAPRESMRLVAAPGGEVRLVTHKTATDLTDRMRTWADKRARSLDRQHLCGYVFKKDSPSCGVERVRVYASDGPPERNGRGLFAAAMLAHHPFLPVEEEGRLNDARLRENFVTRIFAYSRWLAMEREGVTRARLFHFHERHKYVLMAHGQAGMRRLGHLLGAADRGSSPRELAQRYLEEFTAVIARVPTAKSHANVLQHLAGYFSTNIDASDRAELTATIEQYRLGRVPLIVPITLIRHYVRKLQVRYLVDQVYLNPHPHEMMLLNHV
jgi:uncharacterized protein YbgA (DUF1722 family)/uncharacterized protein YbbK (DUF523 family)